MVKSKKNKINFLDKIKDEGIQEYDLPFNIYYHNVQSIRGKKTKSLEFLKQSNRYDYDIICITETHLSNEIPSKQFINANKYKVFRSERDTGEHGGVLIACKHNIEVIECKTNNTYEEIWLTIKYNQQLLHLCCVYISKLTGFEKFMASYIEHLKNMIEEINDERILIVGDYNFPDAFTKKKTKSQNILKFREFLQKFNIKQECKEINNKGNLLDSIITNMKDLNIKRANQVLTKEHPDHIPIIIQSNYMNNLGEAIDNNNNNLLEMENIPLKICQIHLNTKCLLTNWINKFEEYFPFGFLYITNIIWRKDNNDDGTPREISINDQTYIELCYSDNNLLLINKKFLLTYDLSFNDIKTTKFNAFYIKLKLNNKFIKLCFLNHRIGDGTEFLIKHLENLKVFYSENKINKKNIVESINIIIGDYKSKNKKNHNKDINPVINELKFLDLTKDQSRSNVFSNKQINVICNELFNIINTEEIL